MPEEPKEKSKTQLPNAKALLRAKIQTFIKSGSFKIEKNNKGK